ncbi:MAG: dihydroorotase [Gammaproteobacteria bacterium]|tara:strand:+ start:370 stop:1686 length:1317 start_codon:yes stop_codon:yes gene_type:complete
MSSFDLILKNGTVFTPEATEVTDIAVKDGKIVNFGSFDNAAEIIDCTNLFVFPGLIDTQCHFREPGGEHKETLETGTLSAALGGVTGIFEMPNTNPLTITPEAMEFKLKKAHETSYVDFAFYFGGTAEYAKHLSEWENIDGVCGIKIFMGASNGDLLSATDEEIDAIVANGKRVIAVHAEDESIMNENKVTILGDSNDVAMHYKWRSEESCLNATRRIVTIAKKYSRKVHILHITTAQEMAFLKANKDIASAEVLANHLTLHAPDCYDMFGTLAQQNPPIREKHHQDALWNAVADGTVDIVASDHAPHTLDEKSGTYPNTPSGTPGVQTLIPIMLNHVHQGRLSYERLVDLMAYGPYRIHKIKNKCLIRKGFNADFTVVDPKAEHIISNAEQASKSGWTPYDGKKVVGFPTMTIIGGKTIMRDGEITGRSNNQIEFNI